VTASVLVGVLVGAGGLAWVNASSDDTAHHGEHADGSTTAYDARVAELEAAEAAKDAESFEALVAFGADLEADLVPVMTGLDTVLPGDGTVREEPSEHEIHAWHDALDVLVTRAGELPTGATEHNMVRSGMILTLELLGDAVDAIELAATVDAGTAEQLHSAASDARDRAVDTFGLAAMQLDLLSIDADRGHIHLQLPAGARGTDFHGH
jgi:hypothetical protein